MGELETDFDSLVAATRQRINEADARGEEFVRGAVPLARFDLEDVVRLSILGSLRKAGWDSEKLLRVLRKPYIKPYRTQGDGHTARDQRVMPGYLIVYAEVEHDRMNRVPADSWEDVGRFLAAYRDHAAEQGWMETPCIHVADLRYGRAVAQQKLAQVELAREKRAAQLAAVKAERAAKAEIAKSVKLPETEKV